MGEVLKYITIETYEKEKNQLKSGETKVVYEDDEIKIKLMKQGRKVYNIIVNYGTTPIQNIAKNLMVQAY